VTILIHVALHEMLTVEAKSASFVQRTSLSNAHMAPKAAHHRTHIMLSGTRLESELESQCCITL
jgi:hypothetical protein